MCKRKELPRRQDVSLTLGELSGIVLGGFFLVCAFGFIVGITVKIVWG